MNYVPALNRLVGVITLTLLAVISDPFTGRAMAAREVVLKIATLAPEGSVWMQEFNSMNAELDTATSGRFKFKLYAGGIQGDDNVVLRKIRVNQLQGAAFTTRALSRIYPDFLALALPRLFHEVEEVDYILTAMDSELNNAFLENNFVSLGFTGIGFTYMFSKNDILNESDLKRSKPWIWGDDPVMDAIYKAIGTTPISVEVSDVLTALQTGLLDTVFNTPTGILAMQWFNKVEYLTDYPLTYSFGAFLISKNAWSKVPEDLKPVIKDVVTKHMNAITLRIRNEDKRAKEILQERGISVKKPGPELQAYIEKISGEAYKELIPGIIKPATVQKLREILKDHRKLSETTQ